MTATTIEGYACVFNTLDNGNDMIVPGAFTKSLTSRNPGAVKLLWQHDPKRPIGFIDELKEDAVGLFVRARLCLDLACARDVHRLLLRGTVKGLSIGFYAMKADRDAKSGVRTLHDIDLHEVSLVTFPMNPRACITHYNGGLEEPFAPWPPCPYEVNP